MNGTPDISQPFDAAYALVPGNQPGKRIALVKLRETGYFPTSYDDASLSPDDAASIVTRLNMQIEIPANVAESMLLGSMFGWHAPAARLALDYFDRKAKTPPDPPHTPDVEALMTANLWGSHPRFDRADWRQEVCSSSTQLGYWEWVEHQLEIHPSEDTDGS